jgi:hypothetical protein
VHTPRHIRKNSGFSTQDEHIVLLGLDVLTETLYLRYATCSTYMLTCLERSSPQCQRVDSLPSLKASYNSSEWVTFLRSPSLEGS